MEWYEKDPDKVIKELHTSKKGLSQEEAALRLQKYGPNVLPERKKVTSFQQFLEQFKNFLVIILIIAAVVAFAVGEYLDGAAIIAIVILNALFGFIQERKAEKSLEALKKFAAPKSKVVRNEEIKIVDSSSIVPGDVLVLEVGDKVPADCRAIEETNLKVDESVLTGESTPVVKTIEAQRGKLAVADRKNMLFSGTTVVYGRCHAVVVGTGNQTEFGKIAQVLQERETETPLQKKLEVLGKHLGLLIVVISIAVFFIGLSHGIDILEMFLTSVSLAVAAIPEGLPAVVTITLAISLTRMVKKNAIIRRLTAAETLGSTTTICADKTGTLTKNEMTVRKLYVNGKIIDVTGEGYKPDGKFLIEVAGKNNPDLVSTDPDIEMLLTVGMLCNNASLGKENIGDPTELALLVAAKKYGLEDLRSENTRLKEIDFDSQRKMMSVIYKLDGKTVMYTKGAVEEVLKRCTHAYKNGMITFISEYDKKKIAEVNEKFAKEALRVLGFAIKKLDGKEATESEMIFVGLQGMLDPPRPEAIDAIKICKEAGIKVVMITGDHKDTAVAIAKEMKILEKESRVITGSELDEIKDEEFENIVNEIAVYARVSPEHKVRITEALKKKGHIVAMTGDGVNDAPALKKADIGVAMGISGTDVAKEASDMVLTDDNFASIVNAVEEGRGLYDNIKKFVTYLLSCNIAEVMFIGGSILTALPLPLLPLQILWMNLVTDGLPALALGFEPYEKDIMKRKPRNPKESVLNRNSLEFIIIVGTLVALLTFYLFYLELPDIDRARTMAFSSLVVFEMAVALSFRSPEYLFTTKLAKNNKLLIAITSSLILQLVIVYVPFFNDVFHTVPLGFEDWARILTGAFAIFMTIEINKVLKLHTHLYRIGDVAKVR